MKNKNDFSAFFSVEYLKEIYLNHILLSASTGVDNMSHKILWPILDEQLEIITRKVEAKTYTFTKYKLKLISKGKGKPPREISIPTIRDKIALRALCDFLKAKFEENLQFRLPQDVIKLVKKDLDSGQFNYFLKLDVANFYPSIPHEKLIKRLRYRLRDERALTLILNAIQAPTVIKPSSNDKLSTVGVPQGLSISNILAALYLANLDKKFSNIDNFKYYRYVDDVLLFVKDGDIGEIAKNIISDFRRLGLKVYDPVKHPEKSSQGLISSDAFSYLGYNFYQGIISPRFGSIERLRESLLSIFSGYKYSKLKSKEFLEWRINIRVTGCIFQNKSKGWMCFFSEINDEKLLHELDAFLKNLCKRFDVDLKLKTFVRTYYQIMHNRKESSYIPNFDKYTEKDKIYVLEHYFNKKTKGMTSVEIDYNFKKRISRQVKDIETDLKDAGYSS
ncbi:reverse transcriptase domain-containing protein [Citrobacter amalonaticus]